MTCHPRDPGFPLLAHLHATRRPQLLLRTARLGPADYSRDRDLKTILRVPAAPPRNAQTLHLLLDLEEECERLRTHPVSETGAPWRAARHVEVLIALLAEVRLALDWVPSAPEQLPAFTPAQA